MMSQASVRVLFRLGAITAVVLIRDPPCKFFLTLIVPFLSAAGLFDEDELSRKLPRFRFCGRIFVE